MKRKGYFITVFILFFTVITIAQQPAAVRVEEGLLQGIHENGLMVYKGIPQSTNQQIRPGNF